MPKPMLSTLLLVAVAVSPVSGALAKDKYASRAEFVAALAGKTLTTKTQKGKTYVAVYDGKGAGTFSIAGSKPAPFSWTLDGDTLCSTFPSINFTECNHVVIAGAGSAKFIDAKTGKLNNTYSVK